MGNRSVWLDAERREFIVKSSILPATSRLNIGSLVQRRAVDVEESVGRVLLLPQPPNPVDVHMMHEENGVTGRGLDIRHLIYSMVSKVVGCCVKFRGKSLPLRQCRCGRPCGECSRCNSTKASRCCMNCTFRGRCC